jgi:hypothetical protein
LIDFHTVLRSISDAKFAIPLAMNSKALRRSVGRALSVDTYERGDHRYQAVWKDAIGQSSFASRGSLAETKSFQTQNIAELERRPEDRFSLDEQEMLSQARDLVYRLLNPLSFAAGQLAVFQGAVRAGLAVEVPISVSSGSSEQRGTTANWPRPGGLR